jgi:type 1 glutamine amidotransferase
MSLNSLSSRREFLASLSALALTQTASAKSPIPVLIIDGQNNHDWKKSSPVLKQLLEETKLFSVDVLTSPPKKGDFSTFKPDFSKYKVVVSNYNGDSWPAEVNSAFEKFVKDGGGFVAYHAADNAFPEWVEFNKMIAIGGWGGRDEKSGPFYYMHDGKMMHDPKPGKAGSHGARIPFKVVVRDAKHPIMKGMPKEWLHAADELYARLRGPGDNVTVLGTALSDTANKGTGEDEPMLMTIPYGKGRVFHTTLGHDVAAMKCVGFIATLQRGTEWAATGKVTQKLPADFPTADKVSVRG